jgi:hypothetical protein
MLLSIFLALALILQIAIAAILVRQYLRTRDIGWIWLGVAVVIWPVVSRLLATGEKVFIDRIARHEPVFHPSTLVAHGQITMGQLLESFVIFHQLMGACLLLVAVLYLSRAKSQTIRPAAL